MTPTPSLVSQHQLTRRGTQWCSQAVRKRAIVATLQYGCERDRASRMKCHVAPQWNQMEATEHRRGRRCLQSLVPSRRHQIRRRAACEAFSSLRGSPWNRRGEQLQLLLQTRGCLMRGSSSATRVKRSPQQALAMAYHRVGELGGYVHAMPSQASSVPLQRSQPPRGATKACRTAAPLDEAVLCSSAAARARHSRRFRHRRTRKPLPRCRHLRPEQAKQQKLAASRPQKGALQLQRLPR